MIVVHAIGARQINRNSTITILQDSPGSSRVSIRCGYRMPLRCFAIVALTLLMGVTNVASQEEIICPGTVAFTTRNPAIEQHWDCSTTRNMQICSRAAPGSSIREVLAKAVIAAPSARVFAVISDDSRYPEFMPYVTES